MFPIDSDFILWLTSQSYHLLVTKKDQLLYLGRLLGVGVGVCTQLMLLLLYVFALVFYVSPDTLEEDAKKIPHTHTHPDSISWSCQKKPFFVCRSQ